MLVLGQNSAEFWPDSLVFRRFFLGALITSLSLEIPSIKIQTRRRLGRAREDAEEARRNLCPPFFDSAIDRAFYAVFHAAAAALEWNGIKRTRHAGNEAAFRQYLIKLEVIEREYGETYLKARRMRDALFDAPIGQDLPDPAEVNELVVEAQRFVTRIERYLRDAGAMEE